MHFGRSPLHIWDIKPSPGPPPSPVPSMGFPSPATIELSLPTSPSSPVTLRSPFYGKHLAYLHSSLPGAAEHNITASGILYLIVCILS